jgi:hypothetical protein
METEDMVTVGVVALVLYLLLKPRVGIARVDPTGGYASPVESVTSTITYGTPGSSYAAPEGVLGSV